MATYSSNIKPPIQSDTLDIPRNIICLRLLFTYSSLYWLVVSTPLKNMSSSVGMMKFPIEWKNKTCSKPPISTIYIPQLCWLWVVDIPDISHYNQSNILHQSVQICSCFLVGQSLKCWNVVAGCCWTISHFSGWKTTFSWLQIKRLLVASKFIAGHILI